MIAKDDQWEKDIDVIADAFQIDNPDFDREKFTNWIEDQGRTKPGK